MAWLWRYLDAQGEEMTQVAGAAGPFPAQADAETWLGESWSDLLAEGVESVSLLDGERVVYGPMGLRPAN